MKISKKILSFVFAFVLLTNIFLVSQSMLRVGSFITLGIEMLCLIIMVIVLWRYNGFATTKDE